MRATGMDTALENNCRCSKIQVHLVTLVDKIGPVLAWHSCNSHCKSLQGSYKPHNQFIEQVEINVFDMQLYFLMRITHQIALQVAVNAEIQLRWEPVFPQLSHQTVLLIQICILSNFSEFPVVFCKLLGVESGNHSLLTENSTIGFSSCKE